MRGVPEDGRDAPGLAIGIDEGESLDAIVALPIDDEGGIVFFDVDGLGVAVAGQPCGESIGRVEQPGGLWRLGADKIAATFGERVSRRMHGKLATAIDQIEHGHHVFRLLQERLPQTVWTARQIRQAVLDTFDLSENTYRLNQLRYDLRKLKGHGPIERDGSRYAYRLSPEGVQVALLFLFFHKHLCAPSPTAASITGRTRNAVQRAALEAAYHRADAAIQRLVDLLAAA